MRRLPVFGNEEQNSFHLPAGKTFIISTWMVGIRVERSLQLEMGSRHEKDVQLSFSCRKGMKRKFIRIGGGGRRRETPP